MATNKNVWHRRLVAESGAKACWICFKPTSCVLIDSAQSDWFHVCSGHLSDSNFATAKDGEDLAKKKREEEIEKEIARVKQEFEEKMRKKKDKRKQNKESKKPKEDKKAEEKEDEEDTKEKDEKLKELEKQKEPEKARMEGPRVFELHKHFYQMRLQKKRDQEQTRKNRERLRNPATFPSVPSGDL